MRLIHYAKEPLCSVRSTPLEQQGSHRNCLHKPVGLWVSVEGESDWKEWCEGEQWGLERLAFATEITLAAKANVLHVDGAAALDQFHDTYSVIAYRYGGSLGVKTVIEWPRVAAAFDGIIIAPYVWQRRFDGPAADWYYGWDCASGCIWNADAISDIASVQVSQAA